MAANEADYTSGIVLTVGLEERQWRREVGVVVRRWSFSTHAGSEVSSLCWEVEWWQWSCAHFGVVDAVCLFWGIVCGPPEDFRWPVNSWKRKRVVLLWVCSVPSLPVHGLHYMSTSGYSSHTPEIELIKRSVVGYLAHHWCLWCGFWFNSMLPPTHIEG